MRSFARSAFAGDRRRRILSGHVLRGILSGGKAFVLGARKSVNLRLAGFPVLIDPGLASLANRVVLLFHGTTSNFRRFDTSLASSSSIHTSKVPRSSITVSIL